MLIKNLYNLFCGSESQDGRSDCASDVIEEKEHIVIIPEKFKDDIQKLQDYCGVELKSGLCIEIELSELLEILPRERRRKDAYNRLVKFLAEDMNIKLNIKSKNYGNRRNDKPIISTCAGTDARVSAKETCLFCRARRRKTKLTERLSAYGPQM